MNKTLVVIRHEFAVTLRRTSFRVFTLAIPLLMALAVIALALFQAIRDPSAPETTTMGYIDLSGLLSPDHDQGLVRFQSFQDQQAGIQSLAAGEVSALYLVPSDYLQTGHVIHVIQERAGVGLEDDNHRAMEQFLLDNLLEGQLPEERLERVLRPLVSSTVEIDEEGLPVEDTFDSGRAAFFVVLALLIMASIVGTSGYMLQGLNEEKENRIMEVLLSSVTPKQLMLGKLAGLGLAGLVQVILWAAAGIGLFFILGTGLVDLPDLSLPSPLLTLVALLYFILTYALAGALMASLGAITTSQREAGQITFIFIMPFVAPLWFLTALLENPDGPVAQVLSYIPFTAPVASLIRLALDAMGPMDILISLGILGASVAFSVFLAARLFRTFLLMYGQRPKIKQIARTIIFG